MGQVAVTLNGRTYRLRCDDGEEERLLTLAAHIRGRIDSLTAEFGQAGDERLLLMAALLTADDLLDTQDRVRVLETELAASQPSLTESTPLEGSAAGARQPPRSAGRAGHG